MSPALVVLLLSLLLGLQPVVTDLYLPALPSITEHFGAGMAQAQLTLSALLLAFGLSQLVWGPLSDRFGRRPVLLSGLGAFVLASIGCVMVQSIEQLIGWRILQGVAMGAAVMAARAIVRDLYLPAEAAKAMSRGLTGLGILACMSGPLGGVLAQWAGWRVALAALPVFGGLTLLLIALRFEETLSRPNPRALAWRDMARTWAHILRHRTFQSYALLSTACYCGLFTFLAGSSFVFMKVLGLGKAQYGLIMLSTSLSYIAGTFLCRRLLPRLGVRRSVALASALTLTGGTTMGLLALAGVRGVFAIMLPFYLFMVAHGIHQPCSQSGAVGPFPQAAGTASALSGFMMMLGAFVMGGWLGRHLSAGPDADVLPLTNGIWFWSVAISLVGWTGVQRHGATATVTANAEAHGRP